jgi:hypothetical protein
MESSKIMNSTQASGTLFDPHLELGPRQVGLKQSVPFILWLPALAVAVFLSIHRVVTCKPDGSGLKLIAFVSFFVILVHVGRRSDIWDTQP